MAINIRCQKCTIDIKLTAKKCSKCGTPVPKNKKYRVIVRVNGKRITRTVSNLDLAKDIESSLKVDIARGEYKVQKKASAMNLGLFWDEKYLPWLKETKKSWNIDKYNYTNHIEPELGKKSLDSINPFDVEKLVLAMKKKKNKAGAPLSAATIKHQLILLNRIFNVAEKWGVFIGQNPCKKVEKPKLNNEITEYLSANELTRLLDVLEKWENRMQASIVQFSLYTGVRPNEVFKLEWCDIDSEKKTVTLRDPKGKLDQILPLSNKV